MMVVWAFVGEQWDSVSEGGQVVTHVTKRGHLDTNNWHQTLPKRYHLEPRGTGWTRINGTNRHRIDTNCHRMDTEELKKSKHFKYLRSCVSKRGQ